MQEGGSAALLLRIGVKSGGCSGMSYHMDFEDESNVKGEDAVMEYDGGFRLVCDPKSLLYLFGEACPTLPTMPADIAPRGVEGSCVTVAALSIGGECATRPLWGTHSDSFSPRIEGDGRSCYAS